MMLQEYYIAFIRRLIRAQIERILYVLQFSLANIYVTKIYKKQNTMNLQSKHDHDSKNQIQ